jgi:3-deoxy-7-phosphoheptulonate synthase
LGPNYSSEHVLPIIEKAEKAGAQSRLMIDASHGNSQKKHENQVKVVEDVVCCCFAVKNSPILK